MSNLPYNVYVCCVNFEKGGRAMTDVNLVNGTTYVIRRHAESFRTCVHEQYLFLLVSEKGALRKYLIRYGAFRAS